MRMKRVYGYTALDTPGLIGFMNAHIQSGHRMTNCYFPLLEETVLLFLSHPKLCVNF